LKEDLGVGFYPGYDYFDLIYLPFLSRIFHTHLLRRRKFRCGRVAWSDSSSTGCPPRLRANRTLRLAATKLPAPRDEEYEISGLAVFARGRSPVCVGFSAEGFENAVMTGMR